MPNKFSSSLSLVWPLPTLWLCHKCTAVVIKTQIHKYPTIIWTLTRTQKMHTLTKLTCTHSPFAGNNTPYISNSCFIFTLSLFHCPFTCLLECRLFIHSHYPSMSTPIYIWLSVSWCYIRLYQFFVFQFESTPYSMSFIYTGYEWEGEKKRWSIYGTEREKKRGHRNSNISIISFFFFFSNYILCTLQKKRLTVWQRWRRWQQIWYWNRYGCHEW